MAKYRYNNISTMRTFDESPSKWFLVKGEKTTRSEIESLPYKQVKKLVTSGQIMSIQKV